MSCSLTLREQRLPVAVIGQVIDNGRRGRGELEIGGAQRRPTGRAKRAGGAGYVDPDYDLSVEWREAAQRIKAAQEHQQNPSTSSRVLVINASTRNDYTCPGEMSKSFRLAKRVEAIATDAHFDVDFLDLSLLSSDHDLHIHPCKACVSTAMPLCHWPCSCYPNHSLGQVNDWMNEIYERFTACHGVVIVTPVYWYQSPGALKLMIDRLVCADGGNADESTFMVLDPACLSSMPADLKT